jgi:hypothetical protein
MCLTRAGRVALHADICYNHMKLLSFYPSIGPVKGGLTEELFPEVGRAKVR